MKETLRYLKEKREKLKKNRPLSKEEIKTKAKIKLSERFLKILNEYAEDRDGVLRQIKDRVQGEEEIEDDGLCDLGNGSCEVLDVESTELEGVCPKCNKHKIRCFAEAMKYDPEDFCKCKEDTQNEVIDKEIAETSNPEELNEMDFLRWVYCFAGDDDVDYMLAISKRIDNLRKQYILQNKDQMYNIPSNKKDEVDNMEYTKRVKTFTEEEIFEKINSWRNIEVEGAWSSKKIGYDEHECCGQDGSDISFTKKDFELLIKELHSKFMTPQGFRRAVERAGLVGTKFSEDIQSEVDKILGEIDDYLLTGDKGEFGKGWNKALNLIKGKCLAQNKEVLCKCGHEESFHTDKRCIYGMSWNEHGDKIKDGCDCEGFLIQNKVTLQEGKEINKVSPYSGQLLKTTNNSQIGKKGCGKVFRMAGFGLACGEKFDKDEGTFLCQKCLIQNKNETEELKI